MQNKQQEYLKQREKLKYVTQNSFTRKVLDADIMIEQLISDKETFKFNLEPPLPYTVPKWLKVENNLVPAVYDQVWQAVKLGPTFRYCDTKIITHLFTTSGLSLEKLGYLWSLTNVSSPGFLTQQELYVMLASIALVQTGYHVHDIAIINNVHHPILPQLDYNFLNIKVANPAINRSINNNDMKANKSIIFNGISTSVPSTSVPPLHVKPLNDTVSLKQPFKSVNSFNSLPFSDLPQKKNSSPTVSENFRQTDMDVAFAIPERQKIDVDVNFNSGVPMHELDVDFSVPFIEARLKSAAPRVLINSNITTDHRKVDFETRFMHSSSTNCNSLTVNNATNNLEPRSLDLPMFGEKTALPDDEFSEFQSAALTTVEEYSDFQSASPIVKYELDNLSDENLKPACELDFSSLPKHESDELNFLKNEPSHHKTLMEADRYDVFRSLVEPSKEVKVQSLVDDAREEDEDDGDDDGSEDDEDDDDDDDEDEDEFGEFYAADVKQNVVKRELSIKDKCLEACLRLLQEGLNIFSSMSNEQTLKEVLSDERGYKYFSQLKIVYDTSQRFQRQFESTHLNDAIYSTWAKLSKYTKFISYEDFLEEIPSENDVDATLCKLCETKCDVNCVRYAGHNYHVTCINLFLHFVEDSEISAMLNL